MFWDNYVRLCAEKGLSANAVAKENAISSGTVTNWKRGAIPQFATLKKLAAYFNVSTDDLLTKDSSLPSSEKERALLEAYRAHPEMQEAVDLLLGLDTCSSRKEEEWIELYMAAYSGNDHPTKKVKMNRRQWEAIKNAPETDDPLL